MSSATVKRDLDTDESTMHTAGPSSKKPKFEETSSDGPNGVESLDQLENPRATGSSINPSKRKEPKRRKDFRNQDWGRKVGRNASDEEPREEGEKSIRYPKKKIAMLMSFCGTGCSGMQYQTNAQTIEGYLFDALVNAGAISKDNSNNPNKVDLQRSARTDAGVHAAGNVVSLKMITAPPIQPLNDSPNPPLHTTSSLISQINSLLPPQIRVWSFCRTRNKFNARMECDSRKYEYLFPSWMLLPPKPQSALGNRIWQERRAADATPLPNQSFWEEVVTNPSSIDETADYMQDLNRKKAWPVDAETLERFRAMISEYEGTRNFWNYTIGREFMERQSQRYMIKLEVLDPQIIQGTEWISVRFHGQSFMLHQRKMVAMALLAVRTGSPPSLIPKSFLSQRILVPNAPAVGLLLEQPIFDTYNKRVVEDHEELTKQAKLPLDEIESRRRDPIDFTLHKEEIEAFKLEHIYQRMREEEERLNIFDRWLRYIDSYTGNDLDYLNSEGVIPAVAVIKKGGKRKNILIEWRRERILEGDQSTSAEQDVDEDEGVEGLKGKALDEMEG